MNHYSIGTLVVHSLRLYGISTTQQFINKSQLIKLSRPRAIPLDHVIKLSNPLPVKLVQRTADP